MRGSSMVVIGSAVGDPASEWTLWAIVVALGLIGLGLLLVAIWLFRSTRHRPAGAADPAFPPPVADDRIDDQPPSADDEPVLTGEPEGAGDDR